MVYGSSKVLRASPPKEVSSGPAKKAKTQASTSSASTSRRQPPATSNRQRAKTHTDVVETPADLVVVKIEPGTAAAPKKKPRQQLPAKSARTVASLSDEEVEFLGQSLSTDTGKGKGKAKVEVPVVAGSEEDELDESVGDVYESTRIPVPGTQGCKLSERPKIIERLLTYFGTTDKLMEAINSAALVADGSCTLSPVKTFFRSATMLPTPR
ncbi:hypothetical protein MPER_10802, partial [Moniliophthora perniciosa FA553]